MFEELRNLKLTRRGQRLVDGIWYFGTAAVLIFCIVAGWTFLAMLVA